MQELFFLYSPLESQSINPSLSKKHFMNFSLRGHSGLIASNSCSYALLSKETWNHKLKFLLKDLGEWACKVMLACYSKGPDSAITQRRKKDLQKISFP